MPPAVAEKRTQLEREAELLLDVAGEPESYDPDAEITFTARTQDVYVGAQAIACVRNWYNSGISPLVAFDVDAMRDCGKRIEVASK